VAVVKDARATEALGQVYEAIFRDHPSSMCVLRMDDLTFVAANPAFERASGRSFSDLVAGSWGIGGASDYRRAFKPAKPTPPAGTVHLSGDLYEAGSDATAQPNGETGPEPGRSGGRHPRVEYLDAPYYEIRAGEVLLVQAFRVSALGRHRCVADLGVALAGTNSRETDPPRGAAEPRFFGWQDPAGALHTDPTQTLEGGEDVWRVLVRPAPDTTTEIAVQAEREEALR